MTGSVMGRVSRFRKKKDLVGGEATLVQHLDSEEIAAAIIAVCVEMKPFQVMVCLRVGAVRNFMGPENVPTVWSETWWPRLARAPAIRPTCGSLGPADDKRFDLRPDSRRSWITAMP